MKNLGIILAVIAGLFVLHLIPLIVVAILPTWFLAIFAVIFAITLTLIAFWAFVKAFETREN